MYSAGPVTDLEADRGKDIDITLYLHSIENPLNIEKIKV